MKAKLEINGEIIHEINSLEYDEIMDFLLKVRQYTYDIEDEVYVSESGYDYDYGLVD